VTGIRREAERERVSITDWKSWREWLSLEEKKAIDNPTS
jgi:hypothetical protein